MSLPKHSYSDGTTSSEYDDSKILHREDGPAIEYINGCKSWYLNGRKLTTLTKEQLIKYMELNNLTVVHLYLDNNDIIRTSAAKYDWTK